jgi:hypothetical protein
MALRAKFGFQHYQRQDLFGGLYGLTNSVQPFPQQLGLTDALILRPDFWLNFLWKRAIGASVFNASSSSPSVRAYAFSGPPPSPFSAPECASAALQLLLINLSNSSSVQALLPQLPGSGSSYAAWALAPTPQGGPFSALTQLNGAELPSTVDSSKADPSSFLQRILQPAQRGQVQQGLPLLPLSISFVCY